MPRDDLLPGTLDLLILSILRAGDLHGYAIARSIETRSGSVFEIGQGSLYPALYRLERAGKIASSRGTSDTGRRVKIFTLTAAGRDALFAEERGWTRFTGAVNRVIGGT